MFEVFWTRGDDGTSCSCTISWFVDIVAQMLLKKMMMMMLLMIFCCC